MSVKFQLDYAEIDALAEKFKAIPDHVEDLINSYLHFEGVELTKKRITEGMPVSNKKGVLKHAKYSNSLRHKTSNLGFEVMPKPRFNYLVFPDQALGTSKGKSAQKFMHEGLDSGTDDIIQEINERIDQKIKEVLG